LKKNAEKRLRSGVRDLKPEEAAVMMLLRERLAAAEKNGARKVAAIAKSGWPHP
jgi:hypothetical protein